MIFILKMAWRDTRASRRRLLLCALSIVLGVAALVAVGSLRDNLVAAIDDQAKGLLGADLVVDSRQPLTDEARTFLDGLGGRQAREVAFSSMIVFPGGGTRLVQVRAIEGDFPFYGEFTTAPAEARASLRGGFNAVLEESLLLQFNVAVGQKVRLGAAEFTAAGAVRKVPGESAAVATLAPRVFIPLDRLEATGLVGASSLVRHRIYFGFSDKRDVEALVQDLRGRFRTLRLGFDTVAERRRNLGRALTNVNAFLSLVGCAALFLGGIGVASAIHAHVRQKLATVAVLRCLGATARTSFAVYLVQGLALGVIGAALGALLGVGAQTALPWLVRDFLPFPADFPVSWPAVARGVGAGLVVCVLFALLPLLATRRVSPLLTLRSALGDDTPARRDPWQFIVAGAIVAAVVAFSLSQAERWQWGLGYAGALAAGFGVLAGLARLVAWAARRLPLRRLPFVWRQGLANLYRPNNRTVLLLVSLGLGVFLMLTLFLTRATLLGQLRLAGSEDRSNLMLFDIQDDQIGPLTALLARLGTPVRQAAPIVTMRIAAVKGTPVARLLRGGTVRGESPGSGRPVPGWTLRREYRSTYRTELADTEKVTAGGWIGRVAADAAPVPVSVEEGLARDLQVTVGDEIEFDVQGVPMKTVVASLRQVEWRRMQPNFFVVFPAGVLEGAPQFHVVAVRAAAAADSARVQQAVVREFPNISAVDLALIMQTLDAIFAKAAAVVEFLAMFTVVTGVIVLAGAVLTGRHQRIRESVLLRTLGATRRQVNRIMLAEYAALGALGAITGTLLAVGANLLLTHYVFKAPVVLPLPVLLGGWLAVTAVTVATGLLASRGIGAHPPLAVLRQET
jgi:putative ABC transport system permease protein